MFSNLQLIANQLALPGIEQQAITGSNEKVETWEYTNRNAVMYNPEGVYSPSLSFQLAAIVRS